MTSDGDPDDLGPLDPFANDEGLPDDLLGDGSDPTEPTAPGSSGSSSAANPFAGMPLFGDIGKMLADQAKPNWDAARQIAIAVASGGESEANVDPTERIRWEQLARVAELQVEAATNLTTSVAGRGISFTPVTRTQWVQRSLDAFEPLFQGLGEALSEPADADDDDLVGGDPAMAMFAPLMKALSPMMLSMTTGSMIGHLATTSFGQYDLPVPRQPSDDLLVVPANVEAFGTEWSLPADDLRLWICIHEVAWHAVLGVPHVRERLETSLTEYTRGFEPDPDALTSRMESFDFSNLEAGADPMSGFQDLFNDPEILLGAVRSPAQKAQLERLDALLAVLVGYADHVVDQVGEKLLTSHRMITEALQRRRVSTAPSDRFVEKLLGMELDQDCFDAGEAFVAGVVARAGHEGLARLWDDAESMPTPSEVAAPGLWLARIDLPDSPDSSTGTPEAT